jgi:hypothetical protein
MTAHPTLDHLELAAEIGLAGNCPECPVIETAFGQE